LSFIANFPDVYHQCDLKFDFDYQRVELVNRDYLPVFQNDSGGIYFAKRTQKSDDPGKSDVAFICLAKSTKPFRSIISKETNQSGRIKYNLPIKQKF